MSYPTPSIIPQFSSHAACPVGTIYKPRGALELRDGSRPRYLYPYIVRSTPWATEEQRGYDALALSYLYSLKRGAATHHYHPSQRSKSWLPASRELHSPLPSPGCGWHGHPSYHRLHACILLRKKKAVMTEHRALSAHRFPKQLATQSEQADRSQLVSCTETSRKLEEELKRSTCQHVKALGAWSPVPTKPQSYQGASMCGLNKSGSQGLMFE